MSGEFMESAVKKVAKPDYINCTIIRFLK